MASPPTHIRRQLPLLRLWNETPPMAAEGNRADLRVVQLVRGTPLYIAQECVARGEYAPAADVWSLGCGVAEIAAGKPAWSCGKNCKANALLYRIGVGGELPKIPSELSDAEKDFLGKCFVRDSEKRWTAEMLLNHPFVAAEEVGALGRDSSRSRSSSSSSPVDDW